MIRWPNFSGGNHNRGEAPKWVAPRYADALDRERAESLADEGGASGAHIDAAGPDTAVLLVPAAVRGRRRGARTWVIGAAVIGAVLAAGWLLRRRA
jgi:hypothetical protein